LTNDGSQEGPGHPTVGSAQSDLCGPLLVALKRLSPDECREGDIYQPRATPSLYLTFPTEAERLGQVNPAQRIVAPLQGAIPSS
jgi:hypothetical protein